jgi:hypothetical protein
LLPSSLLSALVLKRSSKNANQFIWLLLKTHCLLWPSAFAQHYWYDILSMSAVLPIPCHLPSYFLMSHSQHTKLPLVSGICKLSLCVVLENSLMYSFTVENIHTLEFSNYIPQQKQTEVHLCWPKHIGKMFRISIIHKN